MRTAPCSVHLTSRNLTTHTLHCCPPGVFDWLQGQGRSAALVRQISNPMAGVDTTLLALAGTGFSGRRGFGFMSCDRVVGAAEGMNVLKVRAAAVWRHTAGNSSGRKPGTPCSAFAGMLLFGLDHCSCLHVFQLSSPPAAMTLSLLSSPHPTTPASTPLHPPNTKFLLSPVDCFAECRSSVFGCRMHHTLKEATGSMSMPSRM